MDFLNDEEKMRDFYILTKEEFLKSYSYLQEEDYNATLNKIVKKIVKLIDERYYLANLLEYAYETGLDFEIVIQDRIEQLRDAQAKLERGE